MQLNIYVPKDRAKVLDDLQRAARLTARRKNDLVLDAVEHYIQTVLAKQANAKRPRLRTFNLGAVRMPTREELYEEALDRDSSR